MNVLEATEFCLSLSSVIERDSGHPANVFSFSVGGKKFAYYKTSEPEKGRFSMRVTPERFLELTDQTGIKPAKYMGRFHWITIVNIDFFDEEYLKDLVRWSYNRAVSSLSKKAQAEIVSKVN